MAASSTTRRSSTLSTSRSRPARRCRWTRISGCCSSAPGRHSRTPASTR
jgi:hypothetical protein